MMLSEHENSLLTLHWPKMSLKAQSKACFETFQTWQNKSSGQTPGFANQKTWARTQGPSALAIAALGDVPMGICTLALS